MSVAARFGHTLSVIIPTLNEALRIEQLLNHLQALGGFEEVIVVDGGSQDDTVTRARALGATVLESEPGRGPQQNMGAAHARGDALLFLHADVILPDNATTWIQHALRDPDVVATAFRIWTVDDSSGSHARWWLHLADLRSRVTRHPYGDQALCIRASTFWALDGFPALPLMEDLALSMRLRQVGTVRTLPATVQVSGRRFIARPFFYMFIMHTYPTLFRLGVSAHWLARFYRAVR